MQQLRLYQDGCSIITLTWLWWLQLWFYGSVHSFPYLYLAYIKDWSSYSSKSCSQLQVAHAETMATKHALEERRHKDWVVIVNIICTMISLRLFYEHNKSGTANLIWKFSVELLHVAVLSFMPKFVYGYCDSVAASPL